MSVISLFKWGYVPSTHSREFQSCCHIVIYTAIMCKSLPHHPAHLKKGNITFNALSSFTPSLYLPVPVFLSFPLLSCSFCLYIFDCLSLSVALPSSQSFSLHSFFSSILPLSFFLSLGQENVLCLQGGYLVQGVIDNGAAFAIRRAVFAFKWDRDRNGGNCKLERDKKAQV